MTWCLMCNNTGKVASVIDNETYTCPRCKGESPDISSIAGKGPRFEVRYILNGGAEEESIYGWSDEREVAFTFLQAAEDMPDTISARIVDRWAVNKYDGMSNLELANNIADKWLQTNPRATKGYRWEAIRDKALEIIEYLRPGEGKI